MSLEWSNIDHEMTFSKQLKQVTNYTSDERYVHLVTTLTPGFDSKYTATRTKDK